MNYYRAIFQYIGTRYIGFQYQEDGSTVQSEINKALKNLLDCHLTTKGSSRTDTGVHALKQIVKITSEKPIFLNDFIGELNHHLPLDIRCLSLEKCDYSFQPTTNNLKEYRYFFTNNQKPSSISCPFIVNFSPKLDLASMKHCLDYIIGKHDFCNFYSSGSNVTSTIRTIFLAELTEINPHETFKLYPLFQVPENIQACFELKIQGNGFLKQMNRHVVSALWKVGSGHMSTSEFKKLVNGEKVAQQIWKVAPSHGLFLWDIHNNI